MSRCLALIEQIDNLTRIEATCALLILADAMISRFDRPKSFAAPMTSTISF